jgi:hypothetical protein
MPLLKHIVYVHKIALFVKYYYAETMGGATRCQIKYSYCFQCLRNFFVNFRLDSIVRLTVSILPAECGVTA